MKRWRLAPFLFDGSNSKPTVFLPVFLTGFFPFMRAFLCACDCHYFMAPLLYGHKNGSLTIPACGAAIHRFKPAKDFKIHNVISGCLDPPQTAISYLLHKLLPQPRPAPKQESEGTQITDNAKSHKMSQAAARLMSKCTSIHIFDCQLYDNLI